MNRTRVGTKKIFQALSFCNWNYLRIFQMVKDTFWNSNPYLIDKRYESDYLRIFQMVKDTIRHCVALSNRQEIRLELSTHSLTAERYELDYLKEAGWVM